MRSKQESHNMSALPLIVFDVNETILDLETMEPTFERIFGDKSAMRLWFANLIMYSAALTVAGCYVPFTDIGAAVMKMLADTRGIKINDNDKKELTEKFSTMPPHPEVPAALRKLRAQVATMTNAVYCSGFETSSDDPFRLGAPPYDGKRRRRVCLIKIICRVFALSRHKVRVAHRIFKLAGQAAAPRAIGEHQNGGSTSRASSFSISARLEHNKNENARSRVQPVI
jgi:hypothetical protein